MKIFLASDHAGFKLKDQIKKFLEKKQIEAIDLGPFKYNKDDDYPDFAFKLAKKVAQTKSKGILFCRNGVGVSIVANKVKGVRAVTTNNIRIAKSARLDDDTNVLSLPQDFVTTAQAEKIITTWLTTPFSNQARHRRRINKIKKIETTK